MVAQKNRWNRPLTDQEKALGFLGWHERGFLPHCDFPGMVQFVTFRLADSMPASRHSEWKHLLEIEDNREKRKKLEEYLDRGYGECLLGDRELARIAEKTLLCFQEKRYQLLAWCVMSNHVHVLVDVWQTPLWRIIKSWKQYTAYEAAKILMERRPGARKGTSVGEAESKFFDGNANIGIHSCEMRRKRKQQ